MRTEVIIRATRTQDVLGVKGRRIRELTAAVQKRFRFADGSVELYAEKVNSRGLCAVAQAESLRYKLLGGLAVRRACYGVLRYVMEAGAKGCEVVVSGKLRAQRAKAMKFSDGYMLSAGDPVREYVDSAVRHVLLRQGELLFFLKRFFLDVFFFFFSGFFFPILSTFPGPEIRRRKKTHFSSLTLPPPSTNINNKLRRPRHQGQDHEGVGPHRKAGPQDAAAGRRHGPRAQGGRVWRRAGRRRRAPGRCRCRAAGCCCAGVRCGARFRLKWKRGGREGGWRKSD